MTQSKRSPAGSAIDARPAPGIVPRGFAYLLDLGIVFALFAALQMFVFTPLREAIGIADVWFESGPRTQLYTLTTISLPIWLYFILGDASRRRGTLGKRWLRLRVVVVRTGARIGRGRSFVRTGFKLLPWEIAHVTNNLPVPMWYAEDPGFRFGFAIAGMLFGFYMLVIVLRPDSRAPHDLVAGTAVERG